MFLVFLENQLDVSFGPIIGGFVITGFFSFVFLLFALVWRFWFVRVLAVLFVLVGGYIAGNNIDYDKGWLMVRENGNHRYTTTTSNTTNSVRIASSPPVEQQEPQHGYQKSPILNSSTTTYPVSGRTRDELCDAVRKWQKDNDMGRTIAYIAAEPHLTYYVIKNSKGYTIGYYQVTVNSVIVLPQWVSSGGASEGTKSDWRAFKNAVASHERQHQEIAMEYAQKMVDAYNKLGYYSTQAAAETEIDRIFNSYYEQLAKAQDEFDDEYGESKSYSYLCR